MHKQSGRFNSGILSLILLSGWPLSGTADTFENAQTKYTDGKYRQAIEILKPMAANDNAEAQNLLGLIYAKGNDELAINDNEAVFWFKQAASQGNQKAIRNLAFMEANGRGTGDIVSDDTADEDSCEDE